MATLKIRTLLETDLESLARLYKQFWGVRSDRARMKSRFAELRTDPRYAFFCATIEEKVAGSIMGVICGELYGQCRPFLVIEDLIVEFI